MAWLNAGAQAQEHKYYKRIDLPPTKDKKNNYRYFYSKSAYEAYLQEQNPQQTVNGIVVDAPSLLHNILERVKNVTVSAIESINDTRKSIANTGKSIVADILKRTHETVETIKREIDEKKDQIEKERLSKEEERKRQEELQKPPDIPDNYHIEEKNSEKRNRRPEADKYDNVLSDEEVQRELAKNENWVRMCEQIHIDVNTSVNDKSKQLLVEADYMFPEETWSDFAQRNGLIDPSIADNKPRSFSDLKRIDAEVPDDVDQQAVNEYNLNRAQDYGYPIVDKDKDGYPDGIPNYGYSQNCAYCTLAYEMRQRGYDVEAAAVAMETTNSVAEVQSWYNGGAFTTVQERTPSLKKVEKSILDTSPEGSRGQFVITWTAGGGHSMAYEVRGGTVFIRDCQTNKEFKLSEYPYARYIDLAAHMRTDNLALTERSLVGVRNR